VARALSDAQLARYHEDGFLCPLPALSPAEARDCRASLEAFEASQGRPLGQLPGQLRAKTHLLFPWLAGLVRHPAVLAAVEDLIGPDLLVYHLTMWINITTLIDTQQREQHYGLEHIAVDTDDYPGTLARLRANSVRILEELPPANSRRVCFLEAPDGVQIEVIENA